MGKTIQACHCLDSSSTLTDLLNKMTSPIDSVTLLHVLECVAHQWKLLVGSSPISRFVAQLCKLTLGWTTTISSTTSVSSSSKSSRPTFLNNMLDENDFAHADHEQEISHIEFSRLNDSTSSSGMSLFIYVSLSDYFWQISLCLHVVNKYNSSFRSCFKSAVSNFCMNC